MHISKRLECIANMVDNNSQIIDIGCDHGWLDIYLTIKKNCQCIASDISQNVLKNTEVNITKYNLNDKMKIICPDGLDNIVVNNENIIIISGMGTNTIINILKSKKVNKINNLIIQSNNNIELLRKKIVKLGFYIYNEKIILDGGKYYIIIYFKRGKKKYLKADYLFGPVARLNKANGEFYNKIYDKNMLILCQLPKKYIFKRLNIYLYLKQLKKITSI